MKKSNPQITQKQSCSFVAFQVYMPLAPFSGELYATNLPSSTCLTPCPKKNISLKGHQKMKFCREGGKKNKQQLISLFSLCFFIGPSVSSPQNSLWPPSSSAPIVVLWVAKRWDSPRDQRSPCRLCCHFCLPNGESSYAPRSPKTSDDVLLVFDFLGGFWGILVNLWCFGLIGQTFWSDGFSIAVSVFAKILLDLGKFSYYKWKVAPTFRSPALFHLPFLSFLSW